MKGTVEDPGAAFGLRTLLACGSLVIALSCAACDDEDADEPASATPTCIDVGSDRAALHLAVPDGFTVDEDSVTVDVLLKGTAPSGDVLPPQVAFQAFGDSDERDSDQELLDTALTFAIPNTGTTPDRRRASRRIEAEHLTEITFETQAIPGERRYTVHAQLEKVDSERFAVVLIAPDRVSYEELAHQVLPEVTPGACPR